MTPQQVLKIAATRFLGPLALNLITKLNSRSIQSNQCCCNGTICGGNGANNQRQPRGRPSRREYVPEDSCSHSKCMEDGPCLDCEVPTRVAQRARQQRERDSSICSCSDCEEERQEISTATQRGQRRRR